MDNMSWFDSYRGPKRIIVEPGQASCWIGFSVEQSGGRPLRKEFYAFGPTLRDALAEARSVYESIPKRLFDSRGQKTRSGIRPKSRRPLAV